MIYLATAYSYAPEAGYENAIHAAYILSRRYPGEGIHSPILMWHEVAKLYDLPTDAEAWARVNMDTIRACNLLAVYKCNNYLTSVGVQSEIAFAISLDIPVIYFS